MYLTLLVLLIGTCSSVFAIDLSQAFTQAESQSIGMESVFQSKTSVSNLYNKALKISEDREVTASTSSFDQLKAYFSNCSNVVNQDFMNILYHTNRSFRNTFDMLLPKGTKKPTSKDIDSSYAKFFACRKMNGPTSTDVDNLTNEINNVYYAGYSNAYTIANLNQDNFGSDLFRNGTLDDSDFDLLYDINQVGKILFETFQESPQILFYRLPTAQSVIAQNGGDLSSLSDQSSYQVGGGGGSFPGTTGGPSTTPSSSPSGGGSSQSSDTSSTYSTSLSSNADKLGTIVLDTDKEAQDFITKTNGVATSSPAAAALVFGNTCLSGDTSTPAADQQPTVLEDPVAYMSGIIAFVDNANIDDVVNQELLDQYNKDNPLPPGGSTSDPGYADTAANNFAEQALGDPAPGTCEYGCNGLSLADQAQCELKCSRSCIQKCSDTTAATESSCTKTYNDTKDQCNQMSFVKKVACLASALTQKTSCASKAITDQVLCVSDCTCFLIAGPNGAGRQKIEDMYRIKFCKVPVEKKTVSPGKKVYSIQAIFQEISDVLQGLRDSGQMVQYSKTKEYLDGTIKINLADNFAFQLQVGFKPMYPQKSTTTKQNEEEQTNADLALGVLNMNTSAPEADDYDKYVIVNDIATNQGDSQQGDTLQEINDNIIKFQNAAAAKAATTKFPASTVDKMITKYAQQPSILFVQNMVDFLKDNQIFRNNLSNALLDFTKMSLELKDKIENSN